MKQIIKFRKANTDDLRIYFEWLNDPVDRSLSFNTNKVDFKTHKKWFLNKINDRNSLLLVFLYLNNPIGEVRIEKEDLNQSRISISISKENRGKGFASDMLIKASKYFHSNNPKFIINAFIKRSNSYSIKSFKKAGYEYEKTIMYEGHECLKYILINENGLFENNSNTI
tara:strand:+ start:3056 stop:3562 length:507 start_codon:yes stop_codon:yes gene_type:complete